MATTYTHAQIGIVDASGNVNVIYPITTGADVSIVRTNNANIPTTGTTAQKLADALGALAFKNVTDIISTDGTVTSTASTWSSSVIDDKLTELSSKQDVLNTNIELLKWKNITVPEPTVTTNNDESVTRKYAVDLSNLFFNEAKVTIYAYNYDGIYNEIVPINARTNYIYVKTSNNAYVFAGTVILSVSAVTIRTFSYSSNITQNYLYLVELYIR